MEKIHFIELYSDKALELLDMKDFDELEVYENDIFADCDISKVGNDYKHFITVEFRDDIYVIAMDWDWDIDGINETHMKNITKFFNGDFDRTVKTWNEFHETPMAVAYRGGRGYAYTVAIFE